MQTTIVEAHSPKQIDVRILGKATEEFLLDGDRLRILKTLNQLRYSFEDAQNYINGIRTVSQH